MKKIAFLILLVHFCSIFSFGQSPKVIEDTLVKYIVKFKSIRDTAFRNKDVNNAIILADSAENMLQRKLVFYTSKYPATLQYDFDSLRKQDISIVTSSDGLFRIYSWDHGVESKNEENITVVQYKSGRSVYSCIMPDFGEWEDASSYDWYTYISTFKVHGKTYYLGSIHDIIDNRQRYEGLKIFAIENGKLNANINLIKGDSDMVGELGFMYDVFLTDTTITSRCLTNHRIVFDNKTNDIIVPIVKDDAIVTSLNERYHFNGKYFEKVMVKPDAKN
jgi:hypothetical protein